MRDEKGDLEKRLADARIRLETSQEASHSMESKAESMSTELKDTLLSLRQSQEKSDRVSAEMYEMRQAQNDTMSDIEELRNARDVLRNELERTENDRKNMRREYDSELETRQRHLDDVLSSLRIEDEEHSAQLELANDKVRDYMRKLDMTKKQTTLQGETHTRDVEKMLEIEDECKIEHEHAQEVEKAKAELERDLRRASNARREIEIHFQKQNREMSMENERLVRNLDKRNNEYVEKERMLHLSSGCV